MKVKILEVTGENQGKVYNVQDGSEIGRSKNIAISLDEKNASRKHARFTFENLSVFITDLGSANGTFVNNVKIKEKTELRDGDSVNIGKTKLRIKIDPKAKKNAGIPKASPKQAIPADKPTSSKIVETEKSQIAQFSPIKADDKNLVEKLTEAPEIDDNDVPSNESRISIEIRKGMLEAAKESEGQVVVKEKAIFKKSPAKLRFWDRLGVFSWRFDEFTGWLKFAVIAGLVALMLLIIILIASLFGGDDAPVGTDDNIIRFLPDE